ARHRAAIHRIAKVSSRSSRNCRVSSGRGSSHAILRGATAVIGHGPHVLRGGEWRDSSLVLYSLGNFVNYGTFNLRDLMNRGAVACLDIGGPRNVRSARIASTFQVAPGVVIA